MILIPEAPFLDNSSAPLEALGCDLTDYLVPVRIVDDLELAELTAAFSAHHDRGSVVRYDDSRGSR
jgi:hypothetical protein